MLKLNVNRWVHIVDITLIQFLTKVLNRFTEALEMDNFPFPEEANDIVDIRIITEPKNIIVGDPGFLFSCQILRQVCNRVAFYGYGGPIPGESGCRAGIYTCGVVNEIGSKGRILILIVLQIPGS